MASIQTKVKTIPCFSIPISFVNFGEDVELLNKSLVEDSLTEQSLHKDLPTRSAIDGWQSELDMELKYGSFTVLSNTITRLIYSLLPHYGFTHDVTRNEEFFECQALWVNILTNRSAYHKPHIHGTGKTLFTGVYYPTSGLTSNNKEFYPDEDWSDIEFRCNSMQPGDLVLFDPAAVNKQQVIPSFVNKYPYYGHEIYVKPKKSHLVVFPNYLSHMVTPITLDNFKRMSISFSFSKKEIIY